MPHSSEIEPRDNRFSTRERQILCGLFLAKFDREALSCLGFHSFVEAFNVMALGLGARAASIKNYRDELDPLFPNPRQGWHKRPVRDHCKDIVDRYGGLDLTTLGQLVESLFFPGAELKAFPEINEIVRAHEPDPDSSFARRLETGRAAEQYFLENAAEMGEFKGHSIVDTTMWGCGFDFMLRQSRDETFLAVELKGLSHRSGSVRLTALEHDVASALTQNYYLIVVRNFMETPFHTIYQGPLESGLDFARTERKAVQIAWTARIA